jgi:hypothetical protein
LIATVTFDSTPLLFLRLARFADDLICSQELDALATASAGLFKWTACLSSQPLPPRLPASASHATAAGRTTSAAPPIILEELAARAVALEKTHFHLVGNGQMVRSCPQAGCTPSRANGWVSLRSFVHESRTERHRK